MTATPAQIAADAQENVYPEKLKRILIDISENLTLGEEESAAEILTKILSVDGAASLLDADLVDGLQAAAFALQPTTAGTVDASRAAVVSSAKDITGFRNVGMTGTMTATGGVVAASSSPRNIWVGQTAPMAAADFFDATPSVTETYVSEVFVPCNMTITGVALFNGSDVTGNVTVGLATSAGALIAAAKSASTAGAGADSMQRIPFAVAYAAVGPAIYYIQVQYDSGTARYNAHIIGNHGVLAQTAQTYGTLTAFTAPTTFVTNVSNVAALY